MEMDRRKTGFITHAAVFLVAVVLLAVVNTLTWNVLKWWAIVGLTWGIGVAAHFAVVYLPLTFKKQALGPVDILAISLGSVAVLLTLFSIGVVGRQKPVDIRTGAEAESRGFLEDFSWSGSNREEGDQSIPGTVREVEVQSISGSVQVEGGGSGGADVHWIKTAMTSAAMAAIEPDIQLQGDRLVVKEKRDPSRLINSGSISFTVKIPAGVASITATSTSGSVRVSNVEGGIDQTLTSVSGSVETDLAQNLRAQSTSGRIRFESTGKTVYAHTVSGSISGVLRSLDAGGSVDLASTSGSVDLEAFEGLDAEISLHSVSGSVSCGFPVTVSQQKRNSLEGRIGGGAVPIRMTSTSGSISISRR
jgi:DUF4097 and DUF4098 domain-containing protein YvlB